MIRIRTYISLILLALGSTVSAQELNLPTYTQYLADNPFVLSPTFAGIGDHVKVRLSGVTQWVGIKDAPDTQSLVGDMRLGERSGVGVLFYNDKNGYTRQYGGRLSFAHHLTFDATKNHFFSMGLSYNINQFRIDNPSIPNEQTTTNHNFDVGFLYRIGDFYASVNASNILNKNLDLFAINEPNALRNYYVYTGYRYQRKGSDWELEPSVFYQLFESDGRSSTDINIRLRKYNFEDNYWAGISYRFLNDQFFEPLNVTPMVGLTVSNFFFAYGYQVTLNELTQYNTGTHMITIGIDLFQGISECPCTQRKGSAPTTF